MEAAPHAASETGGERREREQGVAARDHLLSAPPLAWRFQAAAPSSGAAAVAADGSVYVATVEGYVHALDSEGSFRWSHGLTGVPVGAPAVDRAGRVYVATSAQRLYALRPDGRVAWMHRPPTRIVTDVVWSPPGVLYFGGRDRRLYALASWGGPLWNRQMPDPVVAAPSSLGSGWLGVGTAEPDLWLFRGAALVTRAPLPGALSQPILAGAEHWFAVTQGEILAFPSGDEAHVAWRREARHAALSNGAEWLVVEARRELSWLSPKTGECAHSVTLPDEPSAAPSVSDRGVVMVPLVSGELFVVEQASARVARLKVASAPLWAPSFSESSGRVIVTGSGVVAAFDLQDWPTRAEVGDSLGVAPQAPERPERPAPSGGSAEGATARRGVPGGGA